MSNEMNYQRTEIVKKKNPKNKIKINTLYRVQNFYQKKKSGDGKEIKISAGLHVQTDSKRERFSIQNIGN